METTRVPFAPQGETLKYGYTKGHLVMEQEQPQQLLQQQRMLQQQQQMLQQQQLQFPQQSQEYQEIRQQDSLREQQYEQEQRQCSQQQRQQQQQQSQKGYSTCGGDEGVLPSGPLFVEKMSLLMKQLATSGDEASGRPSVATRFDSICPPATSIAAYIPRLYRHFRCSEEVFVFALIYLDRVIRANHIRINALNIHRLVLAASVVGVKFVEDVRYSNRYYARVGGVSLTELNRLELAFLKLVKFDLMVSKEEYAVYRSTVLLACPWRPVSSVPQVEAEEQQQQQQHFVGAADTRVGGVDCRNSLMGPTDQQNYGDAQIPMEQQGRLYALVQQQQQQQREQRHHEQQQHCLSGVVATSTASTVSTTPEAGPPNLPSGTSFGSSAGAVVAAAVAAADLIQQHQLDRLMESLQRTEVSSQEEALMRCPLQQQWQSCGVQYVGAYEQQHPQQQQLSLQQTRLMLQAQAQQAQSQQQQKVSKQQGRLCSPERLLELQHQHHRQMIVHSSCCCCGSIIISSSCCWSSSSNSN
ncbi:Cyclin like protein 3b (Fragment) [Eimeria tenella]|uniref:Cyclin like protein 3b n=1 Tax=Eimeria tenella TaxID=5802 RepID=U6KP68_EIMTE